jgi:hypothetical protein
MSVVVTAQDEDAPSESHFYHHQHLPGAMHVQLYARQGHASMVHLISQAQLLWDRRLFPWGTRPQLPASACSSTPRRDPNNAAIR